MTSLPRESSQLKIDAARSTAAAATLSVKTLISELALDLFRDLVCLAAVGTDEHFWPSAPREELTGVSIKGKLDLGNVHGLQWTPLSERALGLSPKQFWALVAQKPERVLH